MSFIGNVPAESYSPVVKDTFSGNDSTTDFTLSIPATTNSVEVFVENVQQEPTTAYTIAGTTLSFTAAPVTGTNNIYVIHRGPAVQTVVPPGDSITTAMIQDGAVTAAKIASLDKIEEGNSSVEVVDTGTGYVAVTVDGVEKTRTTANGLGIGVTPENGATGLYLSGRGHTYSASDTFRYDMVNAYFNSGWKYIGDGVATQIEHNDGNLRFRFASNNTSGAGASLTWSDLAIMQSNGNLQFNSGYGSVATAYGCRAWVNFNGTGTVAINGSGNVSSVSDGGTGIYTVNFATAMPDVNFSGLAGSNLSDIGNVLYLRASSTSSGASLNSYGNSGLQDASEINFAVFR